MRVLFKEIRAGDLQAVTVRLDRRPSLVDATSTAPPKKDDGQSALQVAIKSHQFHIAHLLMDRGANVDFMESSAINEWNTPVLHDAIRAAVFSSRFYRNHALPSEPPKIEVVNSTERSDRAFAILRAVLDRGADPLQPDTFGNVALSCAVLNARQIIEDPVSDDLAHDLTRIFRALHASGADANWVHPSLGVSLADWVADEPLGELLRAID